MAQHFEINFLVGKIFSVSRIHFTSLDLSDLWLENYPNMLRRRIWLELGSSDFFVSFGCKVRR
jgi:hypothetical protein